MEIQIRWTKTLVNREVYYTCVLDEIVAIQTELDHVAYLLLTENAKKCIAERLQDGNPEA